MFVVHLLHIVAGIRTYIGEQQWGQSARQLSNTDVSITGSGAVLNASIDGTVMILTTEWMDGWMDRRMNGWMDGWIDGCMHVSCMQMAHLYLLGISVIILLVIKINI